MKAGVTGRQIAAAPLLFAEFIRASHTGMSAPRKTVFLADDETTAQKVAIGDGFHYLEADVSAREGVFGYGGETPPAPNAQVSKDFIVGSSPKSSSGIAQTVEEPFFARTPRLLPATGKKYGFFSRRTWKMFFRRYISISNAPRVRRGNTLSEGKTK